jgi:hypothetical protein
LGWDWQAENNFINDITGGAARHFPANYMPFAGAEIFVREHACVRAEIFFGHFLICGAEF